MAMAAAPQVGLVRARSERWWYLALCVVCMIMIANFQYGWSVFVSPLHKAHGWSVSNIQLTFTIFRRSGNMGNAAQRMAR